MEGMRAATDEPRASQGLELRRIARSVGEVQILLGLLAVMYWFAANPAATTRGATPWFLTIAGFGAAILALRKARRFKERPKLRLASEASAMVVFITGLIVLTGNDPGPMSHLYLLPVVTVALVLGRNATLFQLALILACRVLVEIGFAGLAGLSLGTAITLFAELAPTCLVAFLTSALAADRALAARRIQTLSERDHLTGLYEMRTFSQLLEEELRRGNSLALLKIDVDRLKRLNDRFGHPAGDRALLAVAEAIRRATRDSDLCARFGGDEFVVALPGGDEETADIVANRIRHNVHAATQDFDYAMRRLAVSIGTAYCPEDGVDLKTLNQVADRVMQQDQESRRQRDGVLFGAPGSLSA